MTDNNTELNRKVDALLARMTLEEKIGQLNQYSGEGQLTGPGSGYGNKLEDIKAGRVGSMLNVRGTRQTRAMQEAALESRLKIPLLFGLDVIHGYRATFPIPLAEACSWDLDLIRESARIAAKEAAAAGVHWTFAPMVDVARDPRWGRVMEGAGEDTFLNSVIAAARVEGFQGEGIGHLDSVMACAKHFAAYGAAIGGRDYNSVDISDRALWELYLPPFKAAVDAGVATFMASFNDLNGVPATGSNYLQRETLKEKWGFGGFVVSDWGSVGEMIKHGYARDGCEAAEAAMAAGCDMDMESRSYIDNLSRLVEEGRISIETIDDAVRRILRKKFELGLFDDPFRFCDEDREIGTLADPGHILAVRDAGRKSIVLLKNESSLLPLERDLKSIALIGPLVKAENDMKGSWSIDWKHEDHVVSLYEGMQKQSGNTRLLYAKGCDVSGDERDGFAEAVEVAKQADVVIMAVGECAALSGEARSRASIELPGVQEELVKVIQAAGKPMIVLIMAGRPLIFNWIAGNVPAIVYTWWLGSEAGNAIAEVLYGDYNPSAKLVMTFPRHQGQIPIYYNYLNTGRPGTEYNQGAYLSGYIDISNNPQYAFGHGLSYTDFEYGDLELSARTINDEQKLKVSFTLKNSGRRAGEEVVQLYLRDIVSQPVRPVKELKDFRKVRLNPGESRTVTFDIDRDKLAFYDNDLQWIAQAGEFEIMIGSASNDIRSRATFELVQGS